jgi:hypothetical protein
MDEIQNYALNYVQFTFQVKENIKLKDFDFCKEVINKWKKAHVTFWISYLCLEIWWHCVGLSLVASSDM